jgi:hypothetical protein
MATGKPFRVDVSAECDEKEACCALVIGEELTKIASILERRFNG